MKKSKNFLPGLLWVLSIACLVAGVVFFVLDHPDIITIVDNTSEETHLEDGNLSSSGPAISADELANKVPTEESIIKADEKDADSDKPETVEPEVIEPEVAEPEVVKVENPYKDMFLKNSDLVAWLKIPETPVDFPVMWTPEDENYYLYKDIDKKKSRGGCPILDTDSTMYPTSTNLIIHGHNIKGIMFYDLLNYKNKSYMEEHPYIYLYGKDYEHIYEVMAVFRSKVYYTTDTCFKYYKFFNAANEEEFKDFYDNVKELALYDTGVTAEYGDKLITLSTCSSHVENGRFVVVGKEIEPGDQYLEIVQDN